MNHAPYLYFYYIGIASTPFGLAVNNTLWASSILTTIDPSFVPRWVVYKNTLEGLIGPDCTWIDVGCGDNSFVRELRHRCRNATGVDVSVPENTENFVLGNINHLPFPDASADLVTLRFVVEHIERREDLAEIVRILKPGGSLLFLTTNLLSPFVGLPRILPYRIKNYLITRIFSVSETDVFPTFHRLNTPAKVRNPVKGLSVRSVTYHSDLNMTRRSVFLIYLFWHIVTMPKPLNALRSNILGLYEKE